MLKKLDYSQLHFKQKFHLPPSIENPNDNTEQNEHEAFEYGFLLVRSRWVRLLLSSLSENSAAGPDGLPSNMWKTCSRELAHPITKLIRLILSQGVWPKT